MLHFEARAIDALQALFIRETRDKEAEMGDFPVIMEQMQQMTTLNKAGSRHAGELIDELAPIV
jgi:hypothetical protein